jgi:type I restriction enzyme, S subunit
LAGEWAAGTLGDIADLVMGQSPTGDTCNEVGRGFPLLNGPTEFGGNHPKPVQFTTDPRKFAEPGDLLFCVRGSTTGRMNWADQRYAIGRGLAAIRAKEGKEYRHFVRAVIDVNLPWLLASATGSTFPNVSRDQIQEIECSVPTLAEQRAIASVLEALDDKIELNRRMNATLEAMARALFQSWFVDFDPVRVKLDGRQPAGLDPGIAALFPAFFHETKVGHIPAGWQLGRLVDLCILKRGHDLPTSTRTKGPIPVISSSGISGAHSETKVRGPGVVTGRYGTIGKVFYIETDYWPLNTTLYVDDFKGNPPRFIFHVVGEVNFQNYTDKAAVPGVNRNHLHEELTVLPPMELRQAFAHSVSPLWSQYVTNERESRTLATLRDTLLPKLLSGEFQFQEAISRL